MNFSTKLLKTFDYHSFTELGVSLVPSIKYHLKTLTLMVSIMMVPCYDIFGLETLAVFGLLTVFAVELTSGVFAAHIRKEAISSMKLSRFSFKVGIYMALIYVPFSMATSFSRHGNPVAAFGFNAMHTFLVSHIVLENIVSILENLAVISGKDKAAWISKIQEFFNVPTTPDESK